MTLRRSLSLCQVAQSFAGWFSVDEMTEAYVARVEWIHRRTVLRYLYTLEAAGLVEKLEHPLPTVGLRFKWAGWPEAIR